MRAPHLTPGCVPVSYVRSTLSARSIRDFIAKKWTYLLCQEGEEKIRVSFTPNPVNHNCLLHPCEW